MMARLGAMPKFITPVAILHGRCGERTGCPMNRAIIPMSCARPTAKAMCRNGNQIAAHFPARPVFIKLSCMSLRNATDSDEERDLLEREPRPPLQHSGVG